MLKTNYPKKLGLCLSGGGARGAYQIGAVHALLDLGIYSKIKVISGTSIGAANAAILASTSTDVARDLWFNIPKNALKKEGSLFSRLTKEKFKMIENGIFTMDKLDEILLKRINHEQLNEKVVYVTISDGGKEDNVVYEFIKSTFSHYIKHDSKVIYIPLQALSPNDRTKSIIASCSIPFVFSAVKNEKRNYYDGGVFDNVPLKPLIDEGCEEIIVINLNKGFFSNHGTYPNVVLHEIKHKGSLGGVLDFSNEHSQRIFDMGYADVINYFSHLGNIL